MWRCPICGSTNLEQTRSIDGEMFCRDCGFRVEDKSVFPNPFFVEDEPSSKPEVPTLPSLGEQMVVLYKPNMKKQ
jgi:transcription initiation factor TFIIIB Brf1 subunit/transcription initiation factor TFIIB